MNCSRVNPQGHTLYKIALGLLMAVFIGAVKHHLRNHANLLVLRRGILKVLTESGVLPMCV